MTSRALEANGENSIETSSFHSLIIHKPDILVMNYIPQ